MARARNIKPSFFVSEQLADQDPLGRLLFIGLWTLADYKGDLEWKERTIKVQLLPFDNCDVKKLAINLDKSGLIRFHSSGDQIYIHIPNFEKHQNPHKNEKLKGSDIPAFSENGRQAVDLSTLAIIPDKSRLKQNENGTHPADSLILIPDSPILIPESKTSAAIAPDFSSMFAELWDEWPTGYGEKGSRKQAEAVFLKIKPNAELLNAMHSAVDAQWRDKSAKMAAGQFAPNFKHVERWLKNREWENEIDALPTQKSITDRMTDTSWANETITDQNYIDHERAQA